MQCAHWEFCIATYACCTNHETSVEVRVTAPSRRTARARIQASRDSRHGALFAHRSPRLFGLRAPLEMCHGSALTRFGKRSRRRVGPLWGRKIMRQSAFETSSHIVCATRFCREYLQLGEHERETTINILSYTRTWYCFVDSARESSLGGLLREDKVFREIAMCVYAGSVL